MNNLQLKKTMAEAKRFLREAEKLLQQESAEKLVHFYGSKQSGMVRRASLDLTRSLADLRKPMGA